MRKVVKKVKQFGLNALVWHEDHWYVAKAVEVEVASQGKTSKEALANLTEALELYFVDEKVSATAVASFADLKLAKLFPNVQYA